MCNVYKTHLMAFHWKRTIRGHVVIIHGFVTHLHASIGAMLKFSIRFSSDFFLRETIDMLLEWIGRDCYIFKCNLPWKWNNKHMKCSNWDEYILHAHQSGIVSQLTTHFCFDSLAIVRVLFFCCAVCADVSIELVCSCDSMINWLMEH